MVTLALLSCRGVHPIPESVRGLQIVAIETDPPQPTGLQQLRLRTWVADGLGRGADVIVWACVPYEGHCADVFPPGSTGLPLSTWTRVGRLDETTFTTDVAWPLFASIANSAVELPEEVRGKMLVWALACAPGVCPLVDQVAADPVSGSEAWKAAEHALANPQDWIGDLPHGQVSLATKVVPIQLDDVPPPPIYNYGGGDVGFSTGLPNRAPQITEITGTQKTRVYDEPTYYGYAAPPATADTGYEPVPQVQRFRLYDPDGDDLIVRSFVTAGGVVLDQPNDTGVQVDWLEPLSPIHRQIGFLVVDDGRGGTAVWSTAPASSDCKSFGIEAGTPRHPLVDGADLQIRTYGYGMRLVLPVAAHGPVAPQKLDVDLYDTDGKDLVSARYTSLTWEHWDPVQCSGTTTLALSHFEIPEPCKLGGRAVDVQLQIGDRSPPSGFQAVLTLPDGTPCTQ